MTESAKILSPERTVLFPRKETLCQMAAIVILPGLKALKARYPQSVLVSYMNTTAEVRTESDVCSTSANAVKVVENLKENQILFIPDCNLASWVSRFLPKRGSSPGMAIYHRPGVGMIGRVYHLKNQLPGFSIWLIVETLSMLIFHHIRLVT
jgi:quinolinate synthase